MDLEGPPCAWALEGHLHKAPFDVKRREAAAKEWGCEWQTDVLTLEEDLL